MPNNMMFGSGGMYGGGGGMPQTQMPTTGGNPPLQQQLGGGGGAGPGTIGIGGGMYGSNYNTNPSAAMAQFQQYIDPMQWQAQRNAMQAASASGLSGGPLQDVISQANAQFGAQMSPQMAAIYQMAQQMGLGQSEFNASQANQGTLQNQLLQAQQQMQNSSNNSNMLGGLLGGIGSIFGF